MTSDMPIIEELVLPSDVHIVPVALLEPAMREQLDCEPDHFTVTRRGARSTSSVVDGLTARLLERFRSPVTIVDAIVALSQAEDLDPRRTLEESFGVLGGFISDGMLVRAGSELAEPIATTLVAGERVGDLEIVEPVHVVVDTEVYRASTAGGQPVAVKIARPGFEATMASTVEHEAAVLRGLDGRVNPALLEQGTHEGRPYLAVSWCAGADVIDAAAEARATGATVTLLALVERMLAAFAHLHRQSVLHGDVHPRNVLVDAEGAVTVIDFGLSSSPGSPAAVSGGVDLFSAPEIAAARLTGRRPPALTAAGEQYALAALAYLMVTGVHTHSFSLERDAMLRQLRDDAPVTFAQVDVDGLAAVEQTLRRALAKDPEHRFGSVGELLGEFRSACSRDLWVRRDGILTAAGHRTSAGNRFVDDVLARLAAPGELFTGGIAAPTASVMNGGAGFAYALLRMAAIRGDEQLLGHADLWVTQAARQARDLDTAFTSVHLDLVSETIGERSFYHHAAGVHCVSALVAAARGDAGTAQSALAEFVRVAVQPCPHLDTAFGRSGLLIACAQLREAIPDQDGDLGLRALGDRLHRSVVDELDSAPAIADGRELTRLGAAHGWAGYLYALLRWSAAARVEPAATLWVRLDQLAELGRPRGRAMFWPTDSRAALLPGALSASWCNGSAGYVPLWTSAHTAFGDERYARLAAAAAWGAHAGDDSAPGDICCGLAGRAYALAAMHRHTGDTGWLARARALGQRAVERIRTEPMRRDSLYKGEIGVALLVAELDAVQPAGLPLYEPEGWPA